MNQSGQKGLKMKIRIKDENQNQKDYFDDPRIAEETDEVEDRGSTDLRLLRV